MAFPGYTDPADVNALQQAILDLVNQRAAEVIAEDRKRLQAGSGNTGTGVTLAVNFPVPFETVPQVVANPVTSNPLAYQCSASGPTLTGFTLNIARTSGTTSFQFYWIAQVA